MNTVAEKAKDKDDDRQKVVTIIVNGREKRVPKNAELSFRDVVKLAFETPPAGENIEFTITYRRGQGGKPEGTLVEGESVKVKDGMVFNVKYTDKS